MSLAVAGRRIIASPLGTDGGKIGSQRSHPAYVLREGSSQLLKNLIQLRGFRSHRSFKTKHSNPIFKSLTHNAGEDSSQILINLHCVRYTTYCIRWLLAKCGEEAKYLMRKGHES